MTGYVSWYIIRVLALTVIPQMIAKHVMNIHMNREDTQAEAVGEISIEKMKRYIAYCKAFVLQLSGLLNC